MMSSPKKLKLSAESGIEKRELNILDVKLDNLVRIFRFCSSKDRTRLRVVCKDFFEAFKYSWADTSRIKTRILREKNRVHMRYLLKHAGRYLCSLCLKINSAHVLSILDAVPMCKQLKAICLRNNLDNTDDHIDDDRQYEDKIGEIFNNANGIELIYLRSFNLSGACFDRIMKPLCITSLKLVNCSGVNGEIIKKFLQGTQNLERFVVIGSTTWNKFNLCVLEGLLFSNCPLMELHLEGGEDSFNDDLISQLFKQKQKLKKIYLSNYVFSYENIKVFPCFLELYLENVKFGIPFITFYRYKFVNLTRLSLFECNIDDNILKLIKLAGNLRHLVFAGCSFEISDGNEGSLKNLEKLYLVDCDGISESFISEIVECKKLLSLAYRGCYGVEIVRFLEMIKEILTLKTLDISDISPPTIARVDKMSNESSLLIDVVSNIMGLINLDLFNLYFIPIEFLGYLDNLLFFEDRTINLHWEFACYGFQQTADNVELFSEPFKDYTPIEDRCNDFIANN